MSQRNAVTSINMVTLTSAAFVINVLIFPYIYTLEVEGHVLAWLLELFTDMNINIL